MSTHLWSFLAGAASLLLIQHIVMIPGMRKHRMKMVLIDRAKVYLERAKACKFDQPEEALRLHAEIDQLLKQAENIK